MHAEELSGAHSKLGLSTINTVVTVPPWARDEPHSAEDGPSQNDSQARLENLQPFEQRSSRSSFASISGRNPSEFSRWWAFIHPRHHEHSQGKPERRTLSFKDRSMSWLPSGYHFRTRETESFGQHRHNTREQIHDWNMQIKHPIPTLPFTLAHNRTPGWDAPWTPRVPQVANTAVGLFAPNQDGIAESGGDIDVLNGWLRRKRRLRAFILTNSYVPLLFRFINLTFIVAALGLAIRIRIIEAHSHLIGAVGSSPTIVVIFAPLTLVHGLGAIYSEYFGHPLGLWRTSGKLAHTLSEVLFICAWSATLSLCFDNFFMSPIPCASPSSTVWYNNIQRPGNSISEGGIGEIICDHQLALICLVGVGAIMNCTNLVISLFRIFEKVKYHPAATLRRE